jgi:molybdopterin synthase catalytic subunit
VAHLTRDPIVLESLHASVAAPDRGGAALFAGTVRDHHAGRAVVGLEYSAYEPMAEAVAAAILAEAVARWPVRVGLAHRIGALEIGDIAVACVAAGAHREEAFAACRYVIEEVKRRVPIWKRERYADGTEAWVNPAAAELVEAAEPRA